MKAYRRILVATDFSASSRKALKEAIGLAKVGGGEILILHAFQPPALLLTDFAAVSAAYAEIDATLRDDARKALEALAAEARAQGATATPRLVAGAAEAAIVDEAEEQGADLIVMGTVGRRGLPGLLLGSVASRVIASAPCPVLTVRAEETAHSAAA